MIYSDGFSYLVKIFHIINIIIIIIVIIIITVVVIVIIIIIIIIIIILNHSFMLSLVVNSTLIALHGDTTQSLTSLPSHFNL